MRHCTTFPYPRRAVRYFSRPRKQSATFVVGMHHFFVTFVVEMHHFFVTFSSVYVDPRQNVTSFCVKKRDFTDLPPWKSATFTNFYGNFPKSVFFQQKRHLPHFCKSCQNPYLQQGVWTTFKVLKTPLLLLFRGVIGSKKWFLPIIVLLMQKVVFFTSQKWCIPHS